jgi:hypothetical protein
MDLQIPYYLYFGMNILKSWVVKGTRTLRTIALRHSHIIAKEINLGIKQHRV